MGAFRPVGRKPVTLKDIAADTGYSITTISHALKDMSDISEATKAHIRERAQALGYIGNASASSLRSGVTHTIAVLLGDLSNPHFSFMAREIETYLRQKNYSVFFMNTGEDEEVERKAIVLALSKRVDGILLCPAQNRNSSENIRFILSAHIPCVLIGRHFPDLSLHYVVCDDRKGGLLAARQMLRNGHRRILYVDTPIQNSSARERREGFEQALREWPEPVEHTVVRFDEEGRYVASLVDSRGNALYTAVVVFNDLIAWDLLCRLPAYRLRVPEDISLIGFDNLHSYLPLPFPLTSISASKIAMPRKAVDLLIEQIQDPHIPCSHLILDVELIERPSVRALQAPSASV